MPSETVNIVFSVVGEIGMLVEAANISASFLLEAGVVLSSLRLGFPVVIIILVWTGFDFVIYNLKKTSDMKNMYVVGPLKKIKNSEKTEPQKENKNNGQNNSQEKS